MYTLLESQINLKHWKNEEKKRKEKSCKENEKKKKNDAE